MIAKERARIEVALPRGVKVDCLSLSDHGRGANYFVTLTHLESGVHGHGCGQTPAKALEDAKAELAENFTKWQRTPRLAAAKALPAAKPVAKVRGVLFEA